MLRTFALDDWLIVLSLVSSIATGTNDILTLLGILFCICDLFFRGRGIRYWQAYV